MGNGCSSPNSEDILKFVQTQLSQNNSSIQPRQNNERSEQCEYTVTPIFRQTPLTPQCTCNVPIATPQKIESLQFKLSFKP
jgi:hypothetical protein